MTTKVFNERFGKVRLGWDIPAEVAFDPDDTVIRIDGQRLPAESVEYVILYGLRQAFGDRVAGARSESDARMALEAFREALLAGEPVRSGAGGYRRYSEEDVETINVLKAALRKRGMKAAEALRAAKAAVTGGAEECHGISVARAREVARRNLAAMRELGL